MQGKTVSSALLKYLRNVIFLIRIVIYNLRWAIKRYSGGYEDTYTCLLGKTAIITGGNSELGFANSMLLASRGCRIIIASNLDCESEKKKLIESTNNPNIITKYIDLSSFSSVRRFAEDIRKTETKIDFLINNAGVGVINKILSEDGLNNVMQINYFGHLLLTHLLIDQLKASEDARVVFLTSSAAYCHNMEEEEIHEIPNENKMTSYDQFKYYANSKLCVVIAAKELGRKLGKLGIKVNSLDPGVVYSGLVQGVFDNETPHALLFKFLFHFLVSAYGSTSYEVAKNTMYVLTGKNIESGKLYFRCRPNFEPPKVDNAEFRRSIWNKSLTIVGLSRDEILN